MKILFVIKSVCGYGAEKMLVWVANQMVRRNHEVMVYTYRRHDKRVNLNDAITVIAPEKNDVKIPVYGLRKCIKHWKPDYVVSFLLDANVFATLAALGTHVPVVICDRLDPYTPGYWKLWLSKPLFNMSGAAVCQLEKVKEYYKKVIHGPIAVIPNPIIPLQEKVMLPFEQRRNEISCVGRLDLINKRQDLLIKSFALIRDKLPQETKIVFYGDGSDYQKVKDLCVKYKINDSCIFRGKVDKPYQYYKESKVFVMSSDHEGIPNSLIEAMTIGMTCISTDMSPGGGRLLIKDKYNGLLVPRNDVDALADAILYVFTHPQYADAMGNNALCIVQDYTEEKISDMWDGFFQNCKNSKNQIL